MTKEIVGMRSYEFQGKDGDTVRGMNLYLQWTEEKIAGIACESVNVSTEKLDGYDPSLGDEVRVGYNRYGKVDFILPVT